MKRDEFLRTLNNFPKTLKSKHIFYARSRSISHVALSCKKCNLSLKINMNTSEFNKELRICPNNFTDSMDY